MAELNKEKIVEILTAKQFDPALVGRFVDEHGPGIYKSANPRKAAFDLMRACTDALRDLDDEDESEDAAHLVQDQAMAQDLLSWV